MVSILSSGARGPKFDPRLQRGKFWCPNMLSLVSFANWLGLANILYFGCGITVLLLYM